VKLIGFVPYLELPKYYAAADLCVVPSLCEPFGNVALEAMASGKPLVASKVDGLKEFVEEDAGLLVNPGDVNGLAQSLVYLLRNPKARFEMGKNAASHSMEFSWKRTAEETLRIAQRLQK
jgi:glycosyltransferase involved in cell wall biosynthesis